MISITNKKTISITIFVMRSISTTLTFNRLAPSAESSGSVLTSGSVKTPDSSFPIPILHIVYANSRFLHCLIFPH